MNENLIKYLEYYIGLESSPKFAVMINGEWGSGKTWLIENLKDYIPMESLIFFHVSLYGKSSTSQIDDDIYKCLHPILSSKGMIIAGALSKALLKGTLKIDIDGDKKGELNLSFGIPNEKIDKLLNQPQKTLIVFDDFERCVLNPTELFGYINELTEKHGCKVILLANERIFNEEEQKEKSTYYDAKEKVVGVTFKYLPEFETAISKFIDEINNSRLKGIMKKDHKELRNIYKRSESHNLRALRKFIFDFERLYITLPENQKNNEDLVRSLLTVFYILQQESSFAQITPSKLYNAYLTGATESLAQTITKKYEYPVFSRTILSLNTWDNIYNNNKIEKETIRLEIEKTLSTWEGKRETWTQLWEYALLTESDFDFCVQDVIEKLKNFQYNNENIVKHIYGTFISLKKMGFLTIEFDTVKKYCYDAIDFIANKNELEIYDDFSRLAFKGEAWGGLGFNERADDKFIEFSSYIDEQRSKQELHYYIKAISNLLELIKNNDDTYHSMLNPNNDGIKSYHDKPILFYAMPEDFVKAIAECENKESVGLALLHRYTRNGYAKELVMERFFLTDLIKKITEKELKSPHPLTKLKFKRLVNNFLKPSLNSLKDAMIN